MEHKKLEILFITHSNMNDLSFGDSNNDSKFISSFPSHFDIKKIFPKREKNASVRLFNRIKFLFKITKYSIRKGQILVIRGIRLAYIPIIFKKLTRNLIILNLGCTPLYTIENYAFFRNEQSSSLKKVRKNLFYYLEFQLEKLVLRKSNAFFVENKEAKNLITLYGADPSKISTLPYYIQDYFIRDYYLKEFNKGDVFKLGYIGRFHSYDNLPLIIESLIKLKENNVNFKIIFVGDGKTKNLIENLVRDNNLLDYVEFLGAKSHEEIPSLLNEIHCLIVPMQKHINPTTVPIKIVEGILMGKVIITNNTGNIKSLFYNNDDLVINELDPKVLFNKIMKIIDNYKSYADKAKMLREKHINFRTKENFKRSVLIGLNNTLYKFKKKFNKTT